VLGWRQKGVRDMAQQKPKSKPSKALNLKQAEAFVKKMEKQKRREREEHEAAEHAMYAEMENYPILPRRVRRRV
jgi:hypothetical protein